MDRCVRAQFPLHILAMVSPRPVSDSRSPAPLVLSYQGASPDSELLGWIEEGLVSGVVVFKMNAPSDEQLASAVTELRRVAPRPLRIMIDEEGGPVRRLTEAAVSMPSLRSYEQAPLTQVGAAYARVAGRLSGIGVDTLLAPVVDIGAESSGWLHERTYADDPDAVAAMARAVIPAVQDKGVSACAKHFPGTRAVTVDPHHGIAIDPTPQSVWERTDAIPFRAAIVAGVQMVMVGHQRMMGFDATRPACMSALMVRVLLRQRLGFAGLVLTDDLAMDAIAKQYPIEDAVRAAWEAGCNFTLVCQNRLLQRRAISSWREWISDRHEAAIS